MNINWLQQRRRDECGVSISIVVDRGTAGKLRAEAAQRDLTLDDLVEMVVKMVARDDLCSAVLDDE